MSDLLDYPRALEQCLADVSVLRRNETVPLGAASGRVLAETITADRDLPPFNRAQMDGYAIRAADLAPGRRFPVVGSIRAGQFGHLEVPPGSAVAIATGAVVPQDLDSVIEHELSDRGDPVTFTIDHIQAGRAVHPRAADARAGSELIAAGTLLGSHHLGIAASVDRDALPVYARVDAAVLTSGDEVVPTGGPILPHQIRNSNQPMVCGLLERLGAAVTAAIHLPDHRQTTIDAVGAAVADHRLVVTVGGVSAGDADHFPAAFEHHDVHMNLVKAAIQPGKPIRVGVHRTVHGEAGAVVVALPGNPVSALVCTCLFIWPLVRAMSGVTAPLPWVRVTLTDPVKPNPRRQAFRPAVCHQDGRCTVPPWQGSGDLAHTAATTGLVALPRQAEEVPAGTTVAYLAWP